MRQEGPPVLGERGTGRRPFEEDGAELRLKNGDPLRDGLLADAQAGGGVLELAILGDGYECPDGFDVHGSSLQLIVVLDLRVVV